MLVLSRKLHEGIVIGGVVRVVIVDIRGDKIRLGCEAPPDISIHRDEIEHLEVKDRCGNRTSLQKLLDELVRLRRENEELRRRAAC